MNQEKTNEELQIEIDQLKTKISELEKLKFQSNTWPDNSSITDKNGNNDSETTGDINITEFLSKTAMQFVEFPQDGNLYDFVGEQVKKITGKDSYIVVNSVDPKTHFSTVHSILGAGKIIDIISKKVGINPVGMKIEAEDPNIHSKDGKLHVYKEGLYGLLVKTVSKSICKSIEILAGVKKIYVIDLAKQEHFFGNVVIFLKGKTDELKNKQLIETFIKQASIAILKRKAEEALQINERKLNLIINSSPIGICTVDSLGNFITTNKAYEQMVGYTKEELVGLSFFDVTYYNDRTKNKKLLQDMFSKKTKNFYIEKTYIKKDGKKIMVSVNAITIRDTEGNVRFGIGFINDITERLEAENTLRNTNARHSAMIKNIGDVISIVGADGITKYQSSNVEKWFGWETEELIGRNNFDYIHPDDIEKIKIGFGKTLKKETTSIVEFRYKCKNGIYKWIELTAVNRINDPLINGILVNYHDITERKQAELSIRKLSTAVQQSPVMTVITDTKGDIEYVNPMFTQITGYSNAEAIGQKASILKSGKQKDSFYKDMWETIVSGEIWKGQFHNKKKNGEIFWESASISAILNEENEVINFIKIGEDITQQKINETELKQALEKALESDRMKSAFLANMSHEIRTPMNGILGFTELLQDADLSVENQKNFIDIIKESSDRLLNTVNDIIEISKIESGEVKKTIKEVNFLNHLKTFVTFFTPEIKKKGLKIFIDNEISATENVILTDENKLSSIFSNLIKNSIKYTNKGFIKVGFKLNEGQLIFYCKDSGIGIPKNRQKAIFNRFEQADIEDKLALQGSGLGLAIVKSYVEILNGKIWVESEEGKGSIFYVALPYNPVKIK